MAQLNFDILYLILVNALHTSSSLLTLRSVNRAWFEKTGRTPRLWTSLVLNRRCHFTLEYTQFYLQKSGALPIDVHIALPDDVDVSEIGDVAVLLRDQVSRFRSFDLRVQIHDELEAFISSIGQGRPAPLLEYLVLKVQSRILSDTVFDFISLPTAFTPSPRLAHIELPAAPLPDFFPHLPIITSLTIDSMHFDSRYAVIPDIDEIMSFLGSAHSLQHFVYKGRQIFSWSAIADFEYQHSVYIPNLLTVDVTAPGAGVDLLRVIKAPALTDARLDGFRARPDNYEGRWKDSALTASVSLTVNQLSIHSRNLQRLTLAYIEFFKLLTDYRMMVFTDAGFPQLEEVLLIVTDITDEALMCSRSGSNLKRLELRNCERVKGTGLLTFVQNRGSDCFLSLQGCRNLNITQEDMVAISGKIKVEVLQENIE